MSDALEIYDCLYGALRTALLRNPNTAPIVEFLASPAGDAEEVAERFSVFALEARTIAAEGWPDVVAAAVEIFNRTEPKKPAAKLAAMIDNASRGLIGT